MASVNTYDRSIAVVGTAFLYVSSSGSAIAREAGGNGQRAKRRPRTVYACSGYGKSARGVVLADVSRGDARSRMAPRILS